MKDKILITGATSGIGYEMALQLAAKKFDLVLVARRADKLQDLKRLLEQQHGIEVHTMTKDLSDASQAVGLYDDVKRLGIEVTMLVNNAGSGLYGEFINTDLQTELHMIELNVSSVVVLSKLFVQDMIVRKQGRIMNVASLLSFLPFPYYSVYSATKAFVLAFSETFAAELEGTGVQVVTLCPGPVDTPFNSDAMWKTNAYKSNKPVAACQVAQEGVKLLLNGTGKKIVGFNNWFISNLPRITPDTIMMKIKKSLASQQ
jgi:short-subunit dehydrogenase